MREAQFMPQGNSCRRQFMHEVQFMPAGQFMPQAIHARSAILGSSQLIPLRELAYKKREAFASRFYC